MTDNEVAKSDRPSHLVYHVKDRANDKAIWTQIGALWPHKDGKGFGGQLDTVPLDGRITIRVWSENE